jgi:hypothetical protein
MFQIFHNKQIQRIIPIKGFLTLFYTPLKKTFNTLKRF